VARSARSFPRFLAPRLREALADTPAVLIHGPRQSGKTTLARDVGGARGYRYVSFDDEAVRRAAANDPVGFVQALPLKSILDEVQRVPEIFTSLKVAIDRGTTPGRFILTGSTNVLLVPTLADSLAGRMGVLRLHPLAQCEIADARPRFIDTLFRGAFKTGIADRLGPDLAERIVAGGYPAALARQRHPRRAAWYRDYVETQVQRAGHLVDVLPAGTLGAYRGQFDLGIRQLHGIGNFQHGVRHGRLSWRLSYAVPNHDILFRNLPIRCRRRFG